ncbi:MAG: urease accessory protein UreE [Pseudomonadota bacterium]
MTVAADTDRASHTVLRRGAWSGRAELCHLDYDGRFLRRKRLMTDEGVPFLVNLDQTTSVNDGDAFVLSDGELVEVRAAREPLYRVTGDHLAVLAWHIGNRHTPCAVKADHLLIRRDAVLAEMLKGLGACLADVRAPFNPEGGAYGLGRTHGHSHGHGHGEHDHAD